jgi:hypothetical protein
MPNEPQKARTCGECGSTDIVTGVPISQTAESGHIGLSYKALGFLRGSAQLYADVCRSCGTVARLYVREPDKPWIQS